MRQSWSFFLCSCVPTPPADFATWGLSEARVRVGRDEGGLQQFAADLARHPPQQVLVACSCTDPAEIEATLSTAGLRMGMHILDLGRFCFAVHAPAEAHAKARRLIGAAVAAAEATPAYAENLLTVDPQVLIVADSPAGPALAQRLQDVAQPMVYIDGEPDAFPTIPAGKVNWGRLQRIDGHLSDFSATIVPRRGLRAIQAVSAPQVIVNLRQPPALKVRTGLHVLSQPSQDGALEKTIAATRALIGTFSKSEQVTYNPDVCAGGAAGQQACGMCITACPYDAIAREEANPLRITVHHPACEGCGACTSVCPTSALRSTDPGNAAMVERLEALLAGARTQTTATPSVVVYYCGEQGAGALRWAGDRHRAYTPGVLPIEVPCLRYVSEGLLLAPFRLGAAAVGLLGCASCSHGERELLLQKLTLGQQVLEAFKVGDHRLRLITTSAGDEAEAITALDTFAAGVEALTPSAPPGGLHSTGNRALVADAIGALIERTGHEPGGLPVAPGMPYGFADVRDESCTLCRACANVCPPHAFTFDAGEQRLQFTAIQCVGCELCVAACPEGVITLRRELYLERGALSPMTIAQDEMVHCASCDKPFINRRALETIESRVLDLPALLDTFQGSRRAMLRMCPDCRAVAAMGEVERGWQP